MKISFVLPMFNEAANIEAMVGMIRREAAPLLEDYEIVIVDDASTDGCGDIADKLARDDSRIRVIHHRQNRGLGAGIRSGLNAARMPYALYTDSDLPVDFSCLRWVLPKVTADVDLLVGYRLGRAEGVRRAIMSWVYNRLIRVLFGLRVRDVNFAFKLIRRDLLERLDLRSEGSFIDAEILLEARRAGCHRVEVGLDYHVRQAGASSLSSPAVVMGILRELATYLTREPQPAASRVIVNGDDFGLHAEINRAIVEAHRKGVLTSASMLANGPAFEEAAAMARQCPDLEIGVHLTLTQLRPCAPAEEVPALLTGDGSFPEGVAAVIRRMAAGKVPEQQVEAEFRAQIERVRAAGLRITHLDGNQHVHVLPACARVVARLAREYGIPAVRLPREPATRPRGLPAAQAVARLVEAAGLRLACWRAARIFRRSGLAYPDRFFGFANAGRMEREIERLVARAAPGVTEVGCHPGGSNSKLDDATGWGYHWEEEFEALRNASAASALAASGARPGSWSDCRRPPRRRSWAHAAGRLIARAPLYLWFGLAALVVSRPVDPVDKYAAAIVAAGLGLHLVTSSHRAGGATAARQTSLALASIAVYAGFALWANNLWMLPIAVPVIAWQAVRVVRAARGVLHEIPPRLGWAAVLTIVLLAPCFEAKEEYLEKRSRPPVLLDITDAPSAESISSTAR